MQAHLPPSLSPGTTALQHCSVSSPPTLRQHVRGHGRTRHETRATAKDLLADSREHSHSTACSPSSVDTPASSRQRRDVLLSLPALCCAPSLLSYVATPAALAQGQLRQPSATERAAIMDCLSRVMERPKAPVMLRLPFHDAGTYSISGGGNGGANASVRFELDRPENAGLKRGWRVIEQLSQASKGTAAEGSVSQADWVMLAGAHAVRLCKGPEIEVKIGRQDASIPDPQGRLPGETSSAAQLKTCFADKGFSAREFLALSGAHTIGNKGFGGPYDFDNVYYKALLQRPWTNTKDSMASMIGLPTDHVLPDDPELYPMIEGYAADQGAFHRDFTAAYVKLSELGVPGSL